MSHQHMTQRWLLGTRGTGFGLNRGGVCGLGNAIATGDTGAALRGARCVSPRRPTGSTPRSAMKRS